MSSVYDLSSTLHLLATPVTYQRDLNICHESTRPTYSPCIVAGPHAWSASGERNLLIALIGIDMSVSCTKQPSRSMLVSTPLLKMDLRFNLKCRWAHKHNIQNIPLPDLTPSPLSSSEHKANHGYYHHYPDQLLHATKPFSWPPWTYPRLDNGTEAWMFFVSFCTCGSSGVWKLDDSNLGTFFSSKIKISFVSALNPSHLLTSLCLTCPLSTSQTCLWPSKLAFDARPINKFTEYLHQSCSKLVNRRSLSHLWCSSIRPSKNGLWQRGNGIK